jgi:hypothetical protein
MGYQGNRELENHLLIKSQITSTKSQINFKIQYPMTKTGLEFVIYDLIFFIFLQFARFAQRI